MDKIQKGEIKSLGTIDFQLDNGVEGCFVLTEGDTFIRTEIFVEDKPGHFGNKYHSHTMTKPQPPEEIPESFYDDARSALNKKLGVVDTHMLYKAVEELGLKIVKEEGK